MPAIPSSADERRALMRKIIEQRQRCTVSELAEHFEVTQATVRSDLTTLEGEGCVVRTHGGAIAVRAIERETLPAQREHSSAKQKIAAKALELVSDGDTIAIDTGTTAHAFAEALLRSSHTDLTVVSSDLEILLMLEPREDFMLVSAGGVVRHGFHYGYGGITRSALERVRVEKYFATTSTIDFEQGLTTPNLNTANLKHTMMSVARNTYLMVDASKFGKVSFGHFADLDEISCVIVDAGVDAEDIERLKEAVPSVLVAE